MATRRRRARPPARKKFDPVGGPKDVDESVIEGLPARSRFVPIKERFAVTPTSVWFIDSAGTSRQKSLRAYVGDEAQTRKPEAGLGAGSQERKEDSSFVPFRASIFNPELMGMLTEAYTEKGGLVIDPFAGGGTRAVIARALGRDYRGIELREEERDRVWNRLVELGLDDEALVVTGSATHAEAWKYLSLGVDHATLITCPPYWNLEVYSDDPDDLSNTGTYSVFLERLQTVVALSFKALTPGAFSVWVVGDVRHKSGELLDFSGDLIRLHQAEGFFLHDKIVYTQKSPLAELRQGMFDRHRLTVRNHEHVLVFKRGTGKRRPVVGSL